MEVEYYIPNSVAKGAGYEWSSDLRLDLVVRKGAEYVPVELKYPTRRVMTDIIRFGKVLPGVEIVKNQGAQDIVMYNFWKDVRRVEIVRSLFPKAVKGGLSVMLTNDDYYLRDRAPALSAPRSPSPTDAQLSPAHSPGQARRAPQPTSPHSPSAANTPSPGTTPQ